MKEELQVTSELLIMDYVQQIATELLPRDPRAVSRVADLAITSYAGGASVSEACRDARCALRSMARHPTRQPATGPFHIRGVVTAVPSN